MVQKGYGQYIDASEIAKLDEQSKAQSSPISSQEIEEDGEACQTNYQQKNESNNDEKFDTDFPSTFRRSDTSPVFDSSDSSTNNEPNNSNHLVNDEHHSSQNTSCY